MLFFVVSHGGCGAKGEDRKSYWWRNFLSLNLIKPYDFLNSYSNFLVGNGLTSPFWNSNWTGRGILKDCFLLLFSVSQLQVVTVAHMGGWHNGVWV